MVLALAAAEIVLGGVLAILTTIWLENLRKPKLDLTIAEGHNVDYTTGPSRPAQLARYLAVDVLNRPLPRWSRWWSREAADACHGSMTFHDLDGRNLFGRSMSARWSGAPEPTFVQYSPSQGPTVVVDPSRAAVGSRVDVHPGDSQRLDVAARFDSEADCYGWNNESYFSNPVWRNPDWRLPPGRYLVRITVRGAGESSTELFRLTNDGPVQDFRLEAALLGDSAAD